MSYSAPYLDDGGIHLPSYNERLEDLIDGYKRIFGEDVYIGPDTMDYQMIAMIAKCWDDLSSLILDVYNARNPNFASGSALDLLLPMNGIMRNPATQSKVTLKLTGSRNAVLPAGMQAMDEDLHIWEIGEPVTFDGQGNATVTAWCTEPGAIAAGAGTIRTINTPDVNWYSVTNEAEAALGDNTETDAALRKRRSASVSLPSRSIVSGMKAALLNLNGVKGVNIAEHNGDPTLSTNYGLMEAHSIMVSVYGGNDEDIARVIWLKKTPGVMLYGNERIPVPDDYGNENIIRFQRANVLNAIVNLQITTFATHDPSLVRNLIPQAVADYINSLDVGENLIVSMLYAVVYSANPSSTPVFSITSLSVRANLTSTSDRTTIAPSDILRCNPSAIVNEVSPDASSPNVTQYQITIG